MVTPRDTHGLTTNNAKHGNVGMCQNIKPCTPNEPSKSMVNPMVHPNSSTKKWYQDSHSHGENQIRWNPGSLCVTAIQQCFAPSEHHLSDLQHRWMRGVWKHGDGFWAFQSWWLVPIPFWNLQIYFHGAKKCEQKRKQTCLYITFNWRWLSYPKIIRVPTHDCLSTMNWAP